MKTLQERFDRVAKNQVARAMRYLLTAPNDKQINHWTEELAHRERRLTCSHTNITSKVRPSHVYTMHHVCNDCGLQLFTTDPRITS